jgi:hypothetical protein
MSASLAFPRFIYGVDNVNLAIQLDLFPLVLVMSEARAVFVGRKKFLSKKNKDLPFERKAKNQLF